MARYNVPNVAEQRKLARQNAIDIFLYKLRNDPSDAALSDLESIYEQIDSGKMTFLDNEADPATLAAVQFLYESKRIVGERNTCVGQLWSYLSTDLSRPSRFLKGETGWR